MSGSSKPARLFRPWAGLATSVAAMALAHQFGSDGTFDHCAEISPVPLLLVSLACLAAVGVAAMASAGVLRSQDESAAHRLAAILSLGMAALAVFAVLLPMAAALILPPCFQ